MAEGHWPAPVPASGLVSLYVRTPTRDDAECIAWSVVHGDVRLALVGHQWAVRLTPAPDQGLSELTGRLERCLSRLGIAGATISVGTP